MRFGAYGLQRAIDLEQRMNRVLQGFFNVPGRFWVEFDWWILNEMQWSAKVKALRSVIRELESLGYDTAAYAGLTARVLKKSDRDETRSRIVQSRTCTSLRTTNSPSQRTAHESWCQPTSDRI